MRVESVDLNQPPAAEGPARVNGVALHAPHETLAPEELRQRACTELLRQAAQRVGLLDPIEACAADGATRPRKRAGATTPRTSRPTAPASGFASATSCSR